MQTIRSVAVLFATATAVLAAQPNAGPPNFAPWEASLAAQEQRANLLRDEIKSLDSSIETRGDALIVSLCSIRDSKDSRTKVARMKEDTIEAIRRNIRYYRTKRAALKEELRRPTLNLTEEQKRRMIAGFDARIEKRIGQMLEVLKSMPTHKDYQHYTPQGSNWIGPTYALNEDYVQDQHLAVTSARLRREIESGLRKSIARLEQSNNSLKAQMNSASYPASPGKLSEEIEKNDTLIVERRKEIDTVLSFVATPARPIGQKEAIDFDRARQITVTELRADFYTLFARYNAPIPALCAVNATRATIDAAKARAQ